MECGGEPAEPEGGAPCPVAAAAAPDSGCSADGGCSALAEWAERPKAIKTRVVMRGDRAMLRGAAP